AGRPAIAFEHVAAIAGKAPAGRRDRGWRRRSPRQPADGRSAGMSTVRHHHYRPHYVLRARIGTCPALAARPILAGLFRRIQRHAVAPAEQAMLRLGGGFRADAADLAADAADGTRPSYW